jgi:hypothetical protein
VSQLLAGSFLQPFAAAESGGSFDNAAQQVTISRSAGIALRAPLLRSAPVMPPQSLSIPSDAWDCLAGYLGDDTTGHLCVDEGGQATLPRITVIE